MALEEYLKPGDVGEALGLKEKYGGRSSFLAGGTDLLVNIRKEAVKPDVIIDLSGLEELNFIGEEKASIEVGGCVTIRALESFRSIEGASVLRSGCREMGNPLIKNRATLGGNLVNASPAADMAPPLLSLGAEVVLESSKGVRELPLEDFFVGPGKTVLGAGELLRSVRFEPQVGDCVFLKVGQRNASTIAIASISIVSKMVGDKWEELKIALGSVAPTPIRAEKTEEFLKGREANSETIVQACSVLEREISPISDVRASAEYREKVSKELLKKALKKVSNHRDG